MTRFVKFMNLVTFAAWMAVLGPINPAAADPAFERWLQALWPEMHEAGVSRATFDLATRNLGPDLTLPDLDLPDNRKISTSGQSEFVQTPADYIKEATVARLAQEARGLAARHRGTLAAIEQKFGVAGNMVLAIWGRETGFGKYQLPHNAIRVLATQSYFGKRKEFFHHELIMALKMLQDGEVTLAGMRSSWAGTMGLVQFLPSEFYKHGVDFDGDGRRDIWRSVPDALASAAKQLQDKGWQPGLAWAYEVRVPKDFDCTLGVPEFTQSVEQWLKRGFVLAYDRKPSAAELTAPASLLQPEGNGGPAFLTFHNYYVIKEYNFSDLYALFVGHLSDRIGDPRGFETPWRKSTQLRTDLVESMQRMLFQLGFYKERIDGKAGMLTRAALGAYQKSNGLMVDCWPTPAVLAHMRAGVRK